MILEWLRQRLLVDALGIVYMLVALIVVCIWLLKKRQRSTAPIPAPTKQSALPKVGFIAKRLCNRLEERAFFTLQEVVKARKLGEVVLVQVSMGEVLDNRNYREFLSINSKRLDLLIINRDFAPILAVEIDGSGHFLSENSRKNDEIKTAALKSAGIALLRISAPNDDLNRLEKEVRSGAEKLLKRYDQKKNQLKNQ